jgi:DNA-binding transcriptional LysR family regulator
VARRAFDCAWFVYASRGYLASRGRPASFDDLTQHDLVLYVEFLHSAAPTRWLEAYRRGAQAPSRMDSLETACHAALAGGGVAVLPAFVADQESGLERVFPDRVAVNTGWIVTHESLRDTSRVRTVADALLAFFRTHEAMFSGCSSATPG